MAKLEGQKINPWLPKARGEGEDLLTKGTEEFWGVMKLFDIWMVVVVIYEFVKTRRTVC